MKISRPDQFFGFLFPIAESFEYSRLCSSFWLRLRADAGNDLPTVLPGIEAYDHQVVERGAGVRRRRARAPAFAGRLYPVAAVFMSAGSLFSVCGLGLSSFLMLFYRIAIRAINSSHLSSRCFTFDINSIQFPPESRSNNIEPAFG